MYPTSSSLWAGRRGRRGRGNVVNRSFSLNHYTRNRPSGYGYVTDPDWNLDPTAPDTIPNPGDATVWLSGIPPTVEPLTKDSENSGTFTASNPMEHHPTN